VITRLIVVILLGLKLQSEKKYVAKMNELRKFLAPLNKEPKKHDHSDVQLRNQSLWHTAIIRISFSSISDPLQFV